ncbi:MAG TPA: glycosyltransferase family 2 protein [Acidimicrobiales bacterium]|nr:glycosyltransferase family 2 protein [Acidimicrobiales bacterium]
MTDPGHPPDPSEGPGDARSDDDSQAGLPPVVAVVVTHDPGPWFEEALSSLVAQDYPNLSVLVIDAGSDTDPTARVAAVAPAAFVRRLAENRGFGPTANEVLAVVEGASHFLFLHDDVALEPNVTQTLLEEAYRSNAGVVCPKLVAWDDPLKLLAVGASADKSGHVVAFGRGELDQEQHDGVRDVFVAPGGCQLVRADLFAALGGFDPGVALLGDDLDLSWRAQVAGARVLVAPGARVRHREALTSGERRPAALEGDIPDAADPAGQLAAAALRHRLRAVLSCYGVLHLMRVVPQVLVVTAGEAFLARDGALRRTVEAWRWNLSALGDLRHRRRQLSAARALPDREVRRLQTAGSGRLAASVRGVLSGERGLGVGAAGRDLAGAISRGGLRLTAAVWLCLLAFLVVGSRSLLTGEVPTVGQLVPLPGDPWELMRLFVRGWHPSGLGSSSSPPLGFLLAGGFGTLLLGAEELALRLALLSALPIGIVGMHRLTSPIGSWRSRLLGSVLYAAVPLPYDALARGRTAALVAYAAMPWLLARMLRATGAAPFGSLAEPEPVEAGRHRRGGRRDDRFGVDGLLGAEAAALDPLDTEELRVAAAAVSGRSEGPPVAYPPALPPVWLRHPGTAAEQLVPAALLAAIVIALAPPVALAILLAGAAVAVGFVVVGPSSGGLRALWLAGGATGGAAVLLAPWSLELLTPGMSWSVLGGLGSAASDAPGFGEVLSFHTGDLRLAPLGVALLVAGALPLLVGERWRADWAWRLWPTAVFSMLVAWAAGRGWLLVDPPAVDVLLAPAAVAVVLSASLGVAAFETDVPAHRFGWRQVAAVVAALGAVVAAAPGLRAAVDGRWGLPGRDFGDVLSWMPEQVAQGDFRVLWLGTAEMLPGDGWRLSDDLAYTSTRNGPGDATGLWPAPDSGATGLLADALGVARAGETTRLGALLGTLGVRYVAVPLAGAPAGQGAGVSEPPSGLVGALRAQVDLRLVRTDDNLVLFENAAWRPIRSAAGRSVLDPGSSAVRSVGDVPAGAVVVAESHAAGWRLEVAGDEARRSKADGWANAFEVPTAGRGVLEYRTPFWRFVLLALELAAWVAAIRFAVLTVRRRRRATLEADGAAGAPT